MTFLVFRPQHWLPEGQGSWRFALRPAVYGGDTHGVTLL
jgi:hypothetical protein